MRDRIITAIRATSVTPEKIKWLWKNRIAFGKVTMLAGDQGLGKSLITTDLIARFTTARPWPDGCQNEEAGTAIMISAEDDAADTIVPRLIAAQANLENVVLYKSILEIDYETDEKKELYLNLSRDLDRLEEIIIESDAKLVVIDPISAYLAGVDSHKNSDVRAVLGPLTALAQKTGAAIICVSHLNKSSQQAQYRVTGSIAFTAAARSGWIVAKDKDNPARRLVIELKNNLAENQDALAYKVIASQNDPDVPAIGWEKNTVKIDLNEALSGPGVGRPNGEREEAKAFLSELLHDEKELEVKEIFKAAKQYDFSKRTLYHAKNDLKLATRAAGFGKEKKSFWALAEKSSKEDNSCKNDESTTPVNRIFAKLDKNALNGNSKNEFLQNCDSNSAHTYNNAKITRTGNACNNESKNHSLDKEQTKYHSSFYNREAAGEEDQRREPGNQTSFLN